jgi:hypothetical protein
MHLFNIPAQFADKLALPNGRLSLFSWCPSFDCFSASIKGIDGIIIGSKVGSAYVVWDLKR